MDVAAIAASPQTAGNNAFSGLATNFDTFLTLLTTQLRHQDPLDPLDTEQFTSQLVQFSGVEQSIRTNTHLETLIALQSASERGGALSLVGRTATLAFDAAALTDDGAAWRYTLPDGAAGAALAIVDAAGETIARAEGAAAAGPHDFRWNGERADGSKAAPGVYRLIVEAKDAGGAPLRAEVETTALIEAVSFGPGGTMLETAGGLAPLDALRRVSGQS